MAASDHGHRRQDYSYWGNHRDLAMPAYAMRDVDCESGIEAVRRAIERSTGLHVVTCRPDGTSLPERDRHYQMTLGSRVPGGGWCPEAEIWVAIPAPTEAE